MSSTADHWERFLDPEVVRPSLFLATMFITTFEVLKDSVVDRIRDFYTDGWSEAGPIVGPQYQADVVSRDKSIVKASLAWLLEHEVIDDKDIETFEQLRKTRNQLAHQLFDVVTGQAVSDHETRFPILVELLRKIEIWWVVNVEIPCNPDFDNHEIDVEGIAPGTVLSLQMLIQVAAGAPNCLIGGARHVCKATRMLDLHRHSTADAQRGVWVFRGSPSCLGEEHRLWRAARSAIKNWLRAPCLNVASEASAVSWARPGKAEHRSGPEGPGIRGGFFASFLGRPRKGVARRGEIPAGVCARPR